jgi:hypothetical protein
MSQSTLFGAPTRLDSSALQWWIRLLTKNWQALMGRPPYLLQEDLSDLAPLFGNGARVGAIKARIYSLPEADSETRQLAQEVVLIIDGCAVITPEGRILLEVLLDMQRTGQEEIGVERQLSALSTATALRSEWYARWLRKQFESSMSPPVLGAALFLLINGSVGKPYALLAPSDSKRDRDLGAIVLPLIARFSRQLGGNAPETDTGIRQHWAFTQLSRLLGRDIARDRVEEGTAIYVRIGRESNLLEELALRLERAAGPNSRYIAITDFTEGYRRIRGSLAARGQMHEDPTTTRRITQYLLAPEDRS